MKPRTKTQARVILALMIGLLSQNGRSRKLPSKGRRTGACTLPSYFRRASTRATRRQQEVALQAILDAYYARLPYWADRLFDRGGCTYRGFLTEYDSDEPDNRQVIRDLRRAIRFLDAA